MNSSHLSALTRRILLTRSTVRMVGVMLAQRSPLPARAIDVGTFRFVAGGACEQIAPSGFATTPIFHCHILEHQAGGMMGVFRVQEETKRI